MFCPQKNIFIVKSTAGMLAAYSLDKLELIKKFRFSSVGAQDDGFCFSEDGALFYNIERHIDSLHTRISVYDTENFELCNQFFTYEDAPKLTHIESYTDRHAYYVIGFQNKNNTDLLPRYYVAELKEGQLINPISLTEKQYTFITGFKRIELSGFTEKSQEWSLLSYIGYDLFDLEATNISMWNLMVKINII